MSLYISDVAEVMRLVPDRGRLLVLYCAANAFHNVAYYAGRGEDLQQPPSRNRWTP